jgi:hypothetical protein
MKVVVFFLFGGTRGVLFINRGWGGGGLVGRRLRREMGAAFNGGGGGASRFAPATPRGRLRGVEGAPGGPAPPSNVTWRQPLGRPVIPSSHQKEKKKLQRVCDYDGV